jgi:hypothetical protein
MQIACVYPSRRRTRSTGADCNELVFTLLSKSPKLELIVTAEMQKLHSKRPRFGAILRFPKIMDPKVGTWRCDGWVIQCFQLELSRVRKTLPDMPWN